MAHTASFSMTALKEVFGKQLITHELWIPRSRDLKKIMKLSTSYT
jgi:hypothetical protein